MKVKLDVYEGKMYLTFIKGDTLWDDGASQIGFDWEEAPDLILGLKETIKDLESMKSDREK